MTMTCEICGTPDDCLSGKTPCELCGDSEAAISQQERIKALNAAIDQHATDARRHAEQRLHELRTPPIAMSDPGEPETKEQYSKRMEEKAKQREAADKIAQELKKASTEEDAAKHWADKIYKPWPGAMGS